MIEDEEALRAEFDALVVRGWMPALGRGGSGLVMAGNGAGAGARLEGPSRSEGVVADTFLVAPASDGVAAMITGGNDPSAPTVVSGAILASEIARGSNGWDTIGMLVARAWARNEGLAERVPKLSAPALFARARAPAYLGPSEIQIYGTAATAVIITGSMASIAHLGDGAAFVLREGMARRLTASHTLGADPAYRAKVARGEMPSGQSSVLLRGFGFGPIKPFDRIEVPLERGERLLLVTSPVAEVIEAMRGNVGDLPENLSRAADALIARVPEAQRRGCSAGAVVLRGARGPR